MTEGPTIFESVWPRCREESMWAASLMWVLGLGYPRATLDSGDLGSGESMIAPSKSHDHRVRARTSDRREQ